jgi:hypothetical protein
MILTLDTARSVTLGGTTAAARPELAGTVLEDRLRPFASTPGTGVPTVNGVLQERIVRSSVDGTLAFYYRIKELTGGQIRYGISLRFWPSLSLTAVDVDYRIDGLGDVGPEAASCGPEPIRFDFNVPPTPQPIAPTALSRFMFVKMISGKGFPNVTTHDTGGQILIADEAWSALLTDSFRPVA